VLGSQAIRLARRVERITDEDERGDVESLGRGQGAHAPPEGTTADGDSRAPHAEPLGQDGCGVPHHLDTDGGRVGPPLP
jgi:hypothetical protein